VKANKLVALLTFQDVAILLLHSNLTPTRIAGCFTKNMDGTKWCTITD